MTTDELLRFGPDLAAARVGEDTAEWSVWSTTARIVVTDPAALQEAYEQARTLLREVDEAASRFRDDSEIAGLERAAGAPTPVSWLLHDLVEVALDAARHTDGDVDPCLGNGMRAIGYDRDFARVATGPSAIGPVPARVTVGQRSAATATITVNRRLGWRDVVLDDDRITVPADLGLDLGATAKAFTADLIARAVADSLDTGVLVSLGGDIATAGPGPDGGWRILVSDGPDQPSASVTIVAGSALATSSTIRRRWAHDGEQMHHILDPRTGRPAEPVWRTVTVASRTGVMANTLSTAAVVRGRAAVGWLRAQGVSARLVDADGLVTTIGGWPEERG